jgi:hypothetical protein
VRLAFAGKWVWVVLRRRGGGRCMHINTLY